MTFYLNLDFASAWHRYTSWRIAGHRARIVRQGTGRYMVARLESWTYR